MAAAAVAIAYLEPPLKPHAGIHLVKPRVVRGVWTRGELVGMSSADCFVCHGLGTIGRLETAGPVGYACVCVQRAVFRACWGKYLEMRDSAAPLSCRKAEFCADVLLSAKRTLPGIWGRIFDLHFLRGLQYGVCCARLGLTKARFFKSVYIIQQRLGRLWHDLRPYRLWPVSEYLYT